MKQISKVIAVISVLLIGGTTLSAQDCKRMSKREMAGILGGFYYDASRATPFPHDERPLQVQFQVNCFSASVYNFVWLIENMPPRTTIKVFEEGQGSAKRKLVFDSTEATLIDDSRYALEGRDGKRKKLTIVYDVPGSSNAGCILFIIGFRGSDSITKTQNRYVIK